MRAPARLPRWPPPARPSSRWARSRGGERSRATRWALAEVRNTWAKRPGSISATRRPPGALGGVHAHVQRRVVGIAQAARGVELRIADQHARSNSTRSASSSAAAQAFRVTRAHEAGLAGDLVGQLLETLLGGRVAVDGQFEGADAIRDQAGMAAGAEGAVDHDLARAWVAEASITSASTDARTRHQRIAKVSRQLPDVLVEVTGSASIALVQLEVVLMPATTTSRSSPAAPGAWAGWSRGSPCPSPGPRSRPGSSARPACARAEGVEAGAAATVAGLGVERPRRPPSPWRQKRVHRRTRSQRQGQACSSRPANARRPRNAELRQGSVGPSGGVEEPRLSRSLNWPHRVPLTPILQHIAPPCRPAGVPEGGHRRAKPHPHWLCSGGRDPAVAWRSACSSRAARKVACSSGRCGNGPCSSEAATDPPAVMRRHRAERRPGAAATSSTQGTSTRNHHELDLLGPALAASSCTARRSAKRASRA